MPDGLVHESEEKLRAHFLHTGTPSATGLLRTDRRIVYVSCFNDGYVTLQGNLTKGRVAVVIKKQRAFDQYPWGYSLLNF